MIVPWLTYDEYLDDLLRDVGSLADKPECECGAQHTSLPHLHSDYCPQYTEHQMLRTKKNKKQPEEF